MNSLVKIMALFVFAGLLLAGCTQQNNNNGGGGTTVTITATGTPTAIATSTATATGTATPTGTATATASPTASGSVKEFTMTANNFQFSPGQITVKKGDKVRIKVTAMDVMHGFALPGYQISQSLPVGQEQTIEFTADQVGSFQFYCNIPCGSGHRDMKGTLVVEDN